MLIEFSVENHRAFREKQTFSMVASAATERAGVGHVASTGFPTVPYVLREACLFGANGSGKSSLIEAMAFMSEFVRNSFRNEAGEPIPLEPFMFHSKWREKPSEFEAIFIHEETQYQYGFSLNRERVVEEWLFARPKSTGRQRHLFTRSYDGKNDSYEWDISSVHLKGERDSWKSQTRQNALFLSTAMQLNADAVKVVYEWFTKYFRMLNNHNFNFMNSKYTAKKCLNSEYKNRVINFMKEADIAFEEISVEEEKISFDLGLEVSKDVPEHFVNLMSAVEQSAKATPMTRVSVKTIRMDEKKRPVALPLEEESSGTQSLFELAAPILDVLDNGRTLVVDELNSGLHPLAFQHLIATFCNKQINKHNAQLIFTTHDTSVTESRCIGRDQIWLVEKGDDLAATLKPFSDYKTRDARPFQKGYLQGRFGGVPRIAG